MDYATIKLKTQELLADIADGSSTFDDDVFATAIQQAQERLVSEIGVTYIELKTGVTSCIADIPVDAISVVRAQVWDASMTDIVLAVDATSVSGVTGSTWI